MNVLAAGVSYADLQFRGVSRAIATAVLQGADGVALVDPGPSTTLPTLRAALERSGIGFSDVTAILLTHIHLDHAGGCGTLVRENPALRVLVHEKGAGHMTDPSKLVASAARLYGADMDLLWGDILPVPESNLTVLVGGERLRVGGRDLDVAYTPGHASHHVSFFSPDTGIAFVGDTAGIRLPSDSYLLPPTPPPDIDVELWQASLQRIGSWHPETLFITHFGPFGGASAHLTSCSQQLVHLAGTARRILERPGTDEDHEAWFIEQIHKDIRRVMAPADADAYELMGRLDLSWRGIARYWKKRLG